MRIWVLILGALLAGGLLGVAIAVNQVGWPRELSAKDMGGQGLNAEGLEDPYLILPPERPGDPKLQLNEEIFEFGEIAIGDEMSHTFTISNQGKFPLRLKVLSSTCQCTIAELPDNEIPPNGSADVVLKFKAEIGATGAYRHSATLATNDPDRRRVALAVHGRVRDSVQSSPRQSYVRLGHSESHTFRFKVSARGFKFNIKNVELENKAIAGAFSVEYRPFTAEESKDGALHGFELTVDVAPTIPPGRHVQSIMIFTDEPLRHEPLGHRVELLVTGDISVGGGQGWASHLGCLSFGQVERAAGAKRRVYLLLRGPQRDKLTVSVKETIPAQLQVTLGEAAPIGDGELWRLPVDVSVPKGAPAVNLLYSTEQAEQDIGRIVLTTDHPQEPEFVIPVSISIIE